MTAHSSAWNTITFCSGSFERCLRRTLNGTQPTFATMFKSEPDLKMGVRNLGFLPMKRGSKNCQGLFSGGFIHVWVVLRWHRDLRYVWISSEQNIIDKWRKNFFNFSTAKVLLHYPKIWRTKWLTRTRSVRGRIADYIWSVSMCFSLKVADYCI